MGQRAQRGLRIRARLRHTIRGVAARPRLLAALAFALAVAALLPPLRLSTRFLLAWNAGVVLFLVLAGIMVARSSHQALQRRADREDVGAVVLVLTMVSAVVGIAAIAFELHGVKDAAPGAATGRLALSAATILISWVFVHMMFALHYAHDFYAGEDDRRGLSFPEDHKPDYWDFLYFSFTIGAAAQTSDVMITAARTRRFVLAHTILAFLFNTTILALAINVGASLI